MKRITSLFLALILILTAVMAAPLGTTAAATFQEGDELYLRIWNPYQWATLSGTLLYANFTDATREEYGGSIPIAQSGMSDRYAPVSGVEYVSNNLYRYTVTADDAGATAMRFWRGNNSYLWNESVVITAADLAAGNNTAVITDWSNTGYLESTYDYNITATLALSATKGEIGDSFNISITNTDVAGAEITYALYINDEQVSNTSRYTFVPTSNGTYSVKAIVTAKSSAGRVLAADSKTASITIGSVPITAFAADCLYAHAAVDGAAESEAWIKWYNVNDTYYFFMPSSAKAFDSVELYSTFSDDVLLGGTTIPANGTATFSAKPDTAYIAVKNDGMYLPDWNSGNRTVKFLFSSAEAALWVNNTDNFNGYSDFFSYLKADKSNYVAASGAVSTPDGTIEATDIKKMKGRGNTSWNADKKGFNVTFQSAIKLAGMEKCKKFSLISNFQDASLARNRVLYDLADAVGVSYSSDSRFIDLYTNGVYQGSYQMCQKVDVGKNTLVNDFEEDDYLDAETGAVKSDFCFVTEIDSSPAADDFHFTVQNGNNLTMKAPELDSTDPNMSKVRDTVKNKFNAMYNNLTGANAGSYIDLNSLAKVYLINELGKNWDSGATSFFLTYKPDENGVYKFFASPVWDYDNSLGNARGVSSDLNRMGITDYTLPSGWFSTVKGGYTGPNFLAQAIKNPLLLAEVRKVWFEDFVPALDILTSTGVDEGELYSADVYADSLRDSAAMNYQIWSLITNSSWICDHGSLRRYTATYTKNAYGQITGVQLNYSSSNTTYNQYTFDGQFDYMIDWTTSRAAWISAQYISGYKPVEPTEPSTEAPTEAPTEASTLPPEDVINPDLTNAIAAWVFDAEGKTAGDKLTEYGNADDGYAVTTGTGTMTLSVSGTKSRALEWSDAEYGKSGTLITPIMAAGSKNLWGAPYLQFEVSTEGYQDITLTMYLAGSNKAPASWKLQYSVDGAAFTDIDGASFTIGQDNRKVLTAYFDKTALPAAVSDREDLILRLVPVSMETISGGDATNSSGGELAVNAIVIQGREKQDPTEPPETYLLGDANDDGTVDAIDATIIQRHSLQIPVVFPYETLIHADVNRDNELDVVDATFLQRYSLHIPSIYPIGELVTN